MYCTVLAPGTFVSYTTLYLGAEMSETKEFWIVMPEIPADKTLLYPYLSGLSGLTGLGSYSYSSTYTSPPTYQIFHSSHDAYKSASDRTKEGKTFYVAHLKLQGKYSPPPPTYTPVFENLAPEERWSKPK
jgi:hypothetical protein